MVKVAEEDLSQLPDKEWFAANTPRKMTPTIDLDMYFSSILVAKNVSCDDQYLLFSAVVAGIDGIVKAVLQTSSNDTLLRPLTRIGDKLSFSGLGRCRIRK